MDVTTWYLEQTDPAALRPAATVAIPVIRAAVVSPELSRFLYTAVGGDWYWTDRLGWTWRQWLDWLDRPGVETWLAMVEGTPAGYVELDGGSPDDEVEIAYFGLLPAFVGKGIEGSPRASAGRGAWPSAGRVARPPAGCGCTPARPTARPRWGTIGRAACAGTGPSGRPSSCPPTHPARGRAPAGADESFAAAARRW